MNWPAKIFCDTSFFYACLEKTDIKHSEGLEWLEAATLHGSIFSTTWDIVSETITLFRTRSNYFLARQFLERILPYVQIIPMDESVRQEAINVFKKFAQDKDLSFCDCLSYVVLTTQLKGIPAATFDSHFKQLGLPVLS